MKLFSLVPRASPGNKLEVGRFIPEAMPDPDGLMALLFGEQP